MPRGSKRDRYFAIGLQTRHGRNLACQATSKGSRVCLSSIRREVPGAFAASVKLLRVVMQCIGERLALTGQVRIAKGSLDQIDAHASYDILDLPAGPLAIAFGAEARHERLVDH